MLSLRHFFFEPPSTDIDYTELALNSRRMVTDIVIDKNCVHKQLKSLNPHKTAGPDGISPRVLRELADVLVAPLTTLFQASLDISHCPQRLEEGICLPEKNLLQPTIDQWASRVLQVR